MFFLLFPSFCFYYAIRIRLFLCVCTACNDTTPLRRFIISRIIISNVIWLLYVFQFKMFVRLLKRARTSFMNKAKPRVVFFTRLLKYWRWIMWYCYNNAKKKKNEWFWEINRRKKKFNIEFNTKKSFATEKWTQIRNTLQRNWPSINALSTHWKHFRNWCGFFRGIHRFLSIDISLMIF